VATTNGGEHASPCPGCGGTDRFRSWPSQGKGGRWWCRQCGRSGDLIEYLRDFRGMSFGGACAFLGQHHRATCKRLRPGTTKNQNWMPMTTSPPPERWQDNALTFLEQAERRILSPSARDARTWLNRRGLNVETITQCRLGWNPKDVYYSREAWGLSKDAGKGDGSRIWLPAGLVIPCFRDGTIQKLSVRRSNPENLDGPPKWGGRYVLASGSSGKVPMVLGEEKKFFVIVESDLDAILIHQEAWTIVSALSIGSAANKPDEQTSTLLDKADLILVALDADEAGIKSAWDWWPKYFPKATRWPVPIGKDPGEAHQEGVDIKEWILAGLPEKVFRGKKIPDFSRPNAAFESR
jgi:DNA primase